MSPEEGRHDESEPMNEQKLEEKEELFSGDDKENFDMGYQPTPRHAYKKEEKKDFCIRKPKRRRMKQCLRLMI